MSNDMQTFTASRASGWLNSRRLWMHGTVLALCLWGTYAWIMTAPGLLDRNGLVKGTDFLHFYTLGSLALEHRGAELYDMSAQADLAQHRVPQAGRLSFVALYGPQLSLLFAPFAALPYGWALFAWLLSNALLYALCCYAIWRTCANLRSERSLVFVLALAYPGFFHLIAWGQTSALALSCFTAAYLALRAKNKFSAGLAIGCLILKPQLGLAAAFVFVFAAEWKIVAGAVTAAVAQLSVGWAYYGSRVMRDYVWHLLHVRDVRPLLEPRPYQMHSLSSFWGMLLPWPQIAFWLYVLTAVVVLGLAVLCWKSGAPLSVRFSALLIVTVLVSPHLTVYDLVVLAPALLLMADWLRGNPRSQFATWVGFLLYGTYFLPLLGPLAKWTHLQLSVLAMAALLWMVYQNIEDIQATEPELAVPLPLQSV